MQVVISYNDGTFYKLKNVSSVSVKNKGKFESFPRGDNLGGVHYSYSWVIPHYHTSFVDALTSETLTIEQNITDKSYEGFMTKNVKTTFTIPTTFVNGIVVRADNGDISPVQLNNSFNKKATIDYLLS